MRSGGCLVSLLGLGSRSARIWGGGWGVPLESLSYPPPVLADKVQAQLIQSTGGPRAAGEGEGAFLSQPRKARIVHLGLVLLLTDR